MLVLLLPLHNHYLSNSGQLRQDQIVYTTKMGKHAGTKVKTEEKYKATAARAHIYKVARRTKFIKNISYQQQCLINLIDVVKFRLP